MHTSTFLAAVSIALTLAACGADDDAADLADGRPGAAPVAEASSAHGSHGGGGADEGEGEGEDHAGHAGGGDPAGGAADDEMAGMEVLATTTRDDLAVELHSMPPERFYVAEGDGLRPQRPAAGDDAHLMVTLADAPSGVRLPDATVTARVIDAQGQTAFEGPLYPMVGRGMGLHYGENIDVGQAGVYTVVLTVGPPRIGRHRAVERAWAKTVRIQQRVRFDGRALAAA